MEGKKEDKKVRHIQVAIDNDSDVSDVKTRCWMSVANVLHST